MDNHLNLLSLFEDSLKSIISRYEPSSFFFKAVNHTLLNPGKRVRPLLVFGAVRSFGGDVKKAIIPAAAIEILHTYSLVHDDLPCMDDDAMRRGKPTLHTLYGEGQAVLVGDLLLTLAFEVLSEAPNLSSQTKIDLIQTLARRAGGSGMILGQSIDLASEGKTLSFAELAHMHEKKTGDLISASLVFGGIIAGVSKKDLEVLALIGQEIGLSFQIVDDILDEEEEGSILNKTTSVSLLGISKAKEKADELLSFALSKCKSLGIENSSLTDLLPRLIYRKY